MPCLYGSGDFEDVVRVLEDFLRGSGRRPRVSGYGRIRIYKLGLFTRLVLVYNRSDKTFQVCGNSKLLEDLRRWSLTRGGISFIDESLRKLSTSRGGVYSDLFVLLMEYQKLEYILWNCRLGYIASIIFALIVFIVAYFYWMNIFDSLVAMIVFGLFALLLPKSYQWEGMIHFYHPLRCSSYKSRLESIGRELLEKAKLLPSDDPYRKLIMYRVGRR